MGVKSRCRAILPRIGAIDVAIGWYSDGLVGLQFSGRTLAEHELDILLGARAAA